MLSKQTENLIKQLSDALNTSNIDKLEAIGNQVTITLQYSNWLETEDLDDLQTLVGITQLIKNNMRNLKIKSVPKLGCAFLIK